LTAPTTTSRRTTCTAMPPSSSSGGTPGRWPTTSGSRASFQKRGQAADLSATHRAL